MMVRSALVPDFLAVRMKKGSSSKSNSKQAHGKVASSSVPFRVDACHRRTRRRLRHRGRSYRLRRTSMVSA